MPSEAFIYPLFCPNCFAPLDEDNNLYPYPSTPYDRHDFEVGVACNECWVNYLCPDGCNQVHDAPIPHGATYRRMVSGIPGTWECPTTEVTFRYVGPNDGDGWADPDNWERDTWGDGSYLDPDGSTWYWDEDDYHEQAGHEWCEYCEGYTSDSNHYEQHEPYYDDEDYYDDGYRHDQTEHPIGQWESTATHWNPITERTYDGPGEGRVPIPEAVSRVAA